MKFTKEQAVEEITAKITDKDKDLDLARTIDECVENGLKIVGDNGEMELKDFVAFVLPFVATAAGLAHKNAVTATKTLQEKIAELEKKDPAKTDPKKDHEPNSEMKAMLDRIEALEKNKAENEKAVKIATKRSALKTKMAESIKDNDWIDAYLAEINVTEDTDVEAKAKDYIAFYNKTQSKGGRTTPKQTGGDDDGVDSNVKSVVAAAAQIKKSMGHGPVTSTTTNNNNN